MKERLKSSMPSCRLSGIPRIERRNNHWPDSYRITRQPTRQPPADDLYHAGFKDGVSGHAVRRPPGITRKPEDYICFAEAVPGTTPEEQVLVTAQLRGVTVTGAFIPQPAERPEDLLLFVANARIGYQAGFLAVLADGRTVIVRVGNAAGLLQQVRIDTSPYNPKELVVNHRNGLIIASA